MKTLQRLQAAIHAVPTHRAVGFTLAIVALALFAMMTFAVHCYVMTHL